MSILAQLVIALALFVGGIATGVKWHAGQDAIAARAAHEAAQSDARQQRAANDRAGLAQAHRVRIISNQLEAARAQISTLSGRDCAGPGVIGLLNDIGADPVRAAAPEPEDAPAALAPGASNGTGLRRYSTDRDLTGHIAACRSQYAEVAAQLNAILDREDRLHGALPAP